ncbi:MAG: GDP-L-fucose synthase [Gemmatimonadota bacterium]|nr:GDP-L-fucose synthase [Gemmatimonadota bacterium]
MDFWTEKRVAVTGGAGFLGRAVVRKLRERGCRQIYAPRSRDHDLREQEAVRRMYEIARPDLVIHLAGSVGGIGANQRYPGRFFYDNLVMGAHLLEQARRFEVPKFVGIGSVCAYPMSTPVPFREENLWDGYPEATNAAYGLAKKMMLVQGQAYRAEYGYNAIHLLLSNLYGPGENLDPETSHGLASIVRKFVDARNQRHDHVILWGDGSPTREFLYVEDAAEGILLASEFYDLPEPVNLGSGVEISIRDLAAKIGRLAGFAGRVRWDRTRPNGQPRRCVDVTRAKRHFGFEAATTLDEGLQRMISWYEKQPHRA